MYLEKEKNKTIPTGLFRTHFNNAIYYYYYFSHGVGLNSLGTEATVSPIIPDPDDR
jgi:hypothetical protein